MRGNCCEKEKRPPKSQTLSCPLSNLSENTMFRVVGMGMQTAYRKYQDWNNTEEENHCRLMLLKKVSSLGCYWMSTKPTVLDH